MYVPQIWMALTFWELLGIAGQFFLATAVAFVLIALLASHFRFQKITATQKAAPEQAAPQDVLHAHILEKMGTGTREPPPFSVWVFQLHTREGETPMEADREAEILDAVREELQGHLRNRDFLCRYGERHIGLVLEEGRPHAADVAGRLADDIRDTRLKLGSGQAVKVRLDGGGATYPEDGTRAGTLIEKAETAMAEACRADGGLRGAGGGDEDGAASPDSGAGKEGQKNLLDELTGVLKPERVESAVQKYVAKCRKNGDPVSILYLDVDHLERYNEHYGRAAGDSILRDLGALLERELRESDLIGRMGGEEFILVLSCKAEQAERAAHRLCGRIRRTPFHHGSTPLKVAACIGVAGFPDHGTVPRQLFEAAESALLAAKRKGRGTFLVYDPSMPPPPRDRKPVDTF